MHIFVYHALFTVQKYYKYLEHARKIVKMRTENAFFLHIEYEN